MNVRGVARGQKYWQRSLARPLGMSLELCFHTMDMRWGNSTFDGLRSEQAAQTSNLTIHGGPGAMGDSAPTPPCPASWEQSPGKKTDN